MSDETKCPFKVGQWVTDGEAVARITIAAGVVTANWFDERGYFRCTDWSRWTAFEPADIATSSTDRKMANAIRKALEGDTVTCDVCNETVPRGWPCSCDDGRE